MRAPPGNTACRIAPASFGGQSGDSPEEMAVAKACSMRVMGFMKNPPSPAWQLWEV